MDKKIKSSINIELLNNRNMEMGLDLTLFISEEYVRTKTVEYLEKNLDINNESK